MFDYCLKLTCLKEIVNEGQGDQDYHNSVYDVFEMIDHLGTFVGIEHLAQVPSGFEDGVELADGNIIFIVRILVASEHAATTLLAFFLLIKVVFVFLDICDSTIEQSHGFDALRVINLGGNFFLLHLLADVVIRFLLGFLGKLRAR